MKTKIKIYFCDFWVTNTETYDYRIDLPYNILKDHYDVEVVDHVTKDTDLIIHGGFTQEHAQYSGVKKLFISGENIFPNYNQCDYAITQTSFENDRHVRIPLWMVYIYRRHKEKFVQHPNLNKSYFNRKFCADVITDVNYAWPERQELLKYIAFFYKPIDHGGWANNNVGGCVKDKIEFLSNYKFSVAAENSLVDGYVTEKICDAYVANTIPIYLGSSYVCKEFNEHSFINVQPNHESFREVVDIIREIDNNEDLYMQMLNTPRMIVDDLYQQLYNKIESFLINIIEYGQIFTHQYGAINLLRASH